MVLRLLQLHGYETHCVHWRLAAMRCLECVHFGLFVAKRKSIDLRFKPVSATDTQRTFFISVSA